MLLCALAGNISLLRSSGRWTDCHSYKHPTPTELSSGDSGSVAIRRLALGCAATSGLLYGQVDPIMREPMRASETDRDWSNPAQLESRQARRRCRIYRLWYLSADSQGGASS